MAENKAKEDEVENPDIHFEPIVNLKEVEVNCMEDDEEELIKLRSKLFRYDSSADPAEWKERGVGNVRILKHKTKGTCRILMRRDKTLKLCANHCVTADIKLKPNCGSDRAWVWSTPCDFADEEPKPELLAIRFANTENAQKFKKALEDAQESIAKLPKSPGKGDSDASAVAETTEESKSTERVQSGGDAKSPCKENGSASLEGDKEDSTTDSVADKLGALKVEETKSVEDEGSASPEAER